MIKSLSFILMFVQMAAFAFAQPFKFAFLSDTHIGIKNADEDLRRSVEDINSDTSLKFVLITGDITELGTDEEVLLAKKILSKLKKSLYIQTGNHDGNWSPNGGTIFNKAFGRGRFTFQFNGYLFLGTNAGPFMHHKSPGQVPQEDIVWMDSILINMKDKNMPVIYTNHYPQDSSQRNWYEAIDKLKQRNVQLLLVGHGHLNGKYVYDGIPAIMGRSNMRASDSIGAYNIVTISNGTATFQDRKPLLKTENAWAQVELKNHHFQNSTTKDSRPSYSINNTFSHVKTNWQYSNSYDVGSGTASYKNLVIATNTKGEVYALDKKLGIKRWSFRSKGKIYSTPITSSEYIVVASTDSNIYCLHAATGKLHWKYKSSRPFVASPSINNDVVYIGSSDGNFQAINLKDGKTKWTYKGVNDFVMTKPLVYKGNAYFGSWGNDFYALNALTGKQIWKWRDTSDNRMYSPAGCRPVGAHGKVFTVAPDGFMTSFDALTGKIIWRTKMTSVKVRESMGLSSDSSVVYVKTTDGKLVGISTNASEMQTIFTVNLQIGYDVSASPIIEDNGVIYVSSNSGVVSAVDKKTRKILWKHKISNSNKWHNAFK